MPFRVTGKLPTGKDMLRLKKSQNFKGKSFQNQSPTPMMAEDASYWKMFRDYFRKNKNTAPSQPLPVIKTDLSALGNGPAIVWFGHSSYFIRINGKNILVDPVFSLNAAPVSFMVRAFPLTYNYSVDDMPPIDYVVLTHDHYDHLDYRTILKLKDKVGKIYCSLGIGSHLAYWGIDPAIVSEMDWGESNALHGNIILMAAPARHFSGRGIKRNQSLWSSFILKTPDHSVYIGGDSGYDNHFKEIGKKYGPFDLAILEAGQYNVQWPLIHMMPEETVQAAKDLDAKLLLPVHWGRFTLAMHEWTEPVTRVIAKAAELGLEVVTPQIGEPFYLDKPVQTSEWWNHQ